MPEKLCVVFVPYLKGGSWCYDVKGSSSFEAAAKALDQHETNHANEKLTDDAILHVVVEGKTSMLWGHVEHNAKQPNYRHTVGRVRAWVELKKKTGVRTL